MHPSFDQKYDITEEFVFFANLGSKDSKLYIPTDIDQDLVVSNMKSPMEEIIGKLAAGETVVTSSYHGAYWATLLGRKVVGIPTSSKFYDLRHPIPICHRSDWRRYTNLARSYDGALEECRAANLSFYERVMNLV
jgi:exopolysaccharide biosynthesis predicted pyruvyltransferase EpsI